MNQKNFTKSQLIIALFLLIVLSPIITIAQDITLNVLGSYRDGAFDESAAEIVSYDPASQRVFLINGDKKTVDVLDISDPTNPTFINRIDISSFGGGANSVDVSNGKVAVAVEADESTEDGQIVLFDVDGNFKKAFPAGSLPDALAFSPNGKLIVVANEGEPNDDYTIDPEGSITIINLETDRVKQVNFKRFNRYKRLFRIKGIRIFGPNASVAQDLEPEYVAISDDSRTAYVALQENNAYAIVDLRRGFVKRVIPFGFKNHRLYGKGIDASNRDDAINIQNWPVYGMYQPDAIATFKKNGQTFLLTANEGDSRDYDGFSEEARVEDVVLNPYWFKNAETLQLEENLGRLKITTTMGNSFYGPEEYEFLFSYGARSFSIWKANSGRQVYDSGEDFEQITGDLIPDYFNSNNDDNDSFDNRSDDKGPEPEAIEVGHVNGRDYAFIGLERVGGIMIYDITNPYNPKYVDYVNNRNFDADADTEQAGDLGIEDIRFVPADKSPNGKPILITGNEVSGTVTIFEIGEPGSFEESAVNQQAQLRVYPMPFTRTLNIQFPEAENGTAEIVIQNAQTGKVMMNSSMDLWSEKEVQLDASAIQNPGVYILTVKMPDGEIIKRPIVK